MRNGLFRSKPVRTAFFVLSALLVTAAALFLLPLLGRTVYSPTAWRLLLAPEGNGGIAAPILTERFRNTALAFTAGGGLALAGLILQTLFRNPLASPFTLGIAGGASFGAVLAIAAAPFLWGTVPIAGFGAVGSLLGAAAAIALVLFLARGRDMASETVLLAGVGVNFFFSGLILFTQYLSEEGRLFRMIRWTMGQVSLTDPALLVLLAGVVVVSAILLYLFADEMDILLTGDERALSLGVNLHAVRIFLFLLSSVLVSAVVSVCGPIGFVGLTAPHFARRAVGGEHRRLIPVSLLFGALFLAICYTAARVILYPDILPVGVITSLLGGPFFIWLLTRTDQSAEQRVPRP
ncbi:MAG: iron ABC transporter permease [Thermoguttaceae bacterium]|nr:iron ABC transporter permease [Thermoguttaceae bacterium]